MNKKGSCWEGYVQKGMKSKGGRMVPNCVPGMKKGGKYQECGRKSASGSDRKYPKCVPLAKATAMTKSQKASAVAERDR